MNYTDIKTLKEKLERMRPQITTQMYRTILGQIRSGDLDGAKRGMNRVINRMRCKEVAGYENSSRN